MSQATSKKTITSLQLIFASRRRTKALCRRRTFCSRLKQAEHEADLLAWLWLKCRFTLLA
ncbi:hypothetical protein VTO58DRAFT_103379 [Aureobasidium pullulans]